MSSTPHRGGALLNVLVVVGVLSIIGLAFLQRSGDDGAAAAAQRAATRASTCAVAARELLLSQFRAGVSSAGMGVSDMSNRIARVGMGGQLYRMTVVCSSGQAGGVGAHQSEVEYLVRFGL